MSQGRPDNAEGWVRLGVSLIEAGQTLSAPRCFAEAARLEPRNAQHQARLGKVLLSLRRYESALEALEKACAIEPRSAPWHTLLGYARREQNDIDGALAAYARAREADPQSLSCAVAEALLLPPIYRDMPDVERWRSRFEQGLQRLHAELPDHPGWAAQVLGLEWENFSLAHQGRDDRRLQTLYAEFVARLLAEALPQCQSREPRAESHGRRIRVGFLSSELRTCTIGDYFGSWILGLPRDRFELRCYFTGSIRDDLTASIANACDAFQALPGGVETVAARVRADRLDVLIFPDVGLTAQSYLLANLRLAPIQCAAWGHPVTTGSRHIEHYVSCAEMEPDGAAEHYRENLLLLPGLGVRYEQPRDTARRPRSDFGLPEKAHVYICPNRLHKILPDWDDVVLDILTKDPEGIVVFFDTAAPGQRKAFVERLQGKMAGRGIGPRRQIRFLPLLPRAEFRVALALADVMLDTPNFSAGSSALDALAVGLPIVAQEGAFMRGRQSAAMLRIVGVSDLVVRHHGDCAELALRVATDRAYRSSLSERIRAGLPRLFDRGEPIAALAETLRYLTS